MGLGHTTREPPPFVLENPSNNNLIGCFESGTSDKVASPNGAAIKPVNFLG